MSIITEKLLGFNRILRNADGGGAPGGEPGGATPSPAPGDGGTPGGTPAPSPAPVKHWTGAADQDAAEISAYVEKKGWKDPTAIPAIIKSYQSLERYLGADKAGRGIIAPKEDATVEEWNKVYSALGRPEKAEEYKITVPDGNDGKLAETARGWFHEAGLNQKQVETITAKWNALNAEVKKQADDEFDAKSGAELKEIENSWGENFKANAELGTRATRALGLNEKDLEGIERSIGTKRMMEMFLKVGSNMQESGFIEGQTKPGKFGVMTKEQAVERLNEMKADTSIFAKLSAGDTQTKAEYEYLNRLIAGEGFVAGAPQKAEK